MAELLILPTWCNCRPPSPFPVKFCFLSSPKLAISTAKYNRSPLLLPHQCRSSNGEVLRDTIGSSRSSLYVGSGGGALFSLFREMGFADGDVAALLNDNPILRLKPVEDVRSRVRNLEALGITGVALYRVVLKCSKVLTAKEVDSLLSVLLDDNDEDGGLGLCLKGMIEPAQVERLLMTTEPSFFLGFDVKVRLLMQHGIPQEKLVHVLNKVHLTKALCHKSVGEIERVFLFLQRFGGIDLILKRPAILNADLDTQLMPRIEFLFNLSGGDEKATAVVLRKLPFLVAYSSDHMSDHVEFLKSFAGLSEEEIFRIVVIYPNIFSASRVRKLHPRIEFLKQCGLDSQEIYRFLIKAPLFLALSYEENIACKLVTLVKIGFKHRTKELATAMGAVTRTSCKNLQKLIEVFLSYGLDCGEILEMSKKHPQILQYNHESLDQKLKYLVEDMGRGVEELLAFPAFLGYRLDGRIKQRYEVKKKILGEGLSLNKLLSVSTARFSDS